MKCVKSVLGEFSSGISIRRNKGAQSDLGAPFCPGLPRPEGTGGPSSGSATSTTSHLLSCVSVP